MTPEERTRIDKLAPMHQSAIVVMQALLDHHTPPGEPAQSVNPKVAVDACLLVVAALIEVDSGAETTRGLREALDNVANLLKTFGQEFRKEFDTSGRRGLEQLGVTDLWREPIN